MKLFKGQVIHVKATVENPEPDRDDAILISINGYETYTIIDNIIHAEPAPLAVGDLVTWGMGAINYTILHIDDGDAFLKRADLERGHHHTIPISGLRRVAT